MGEKFMTCTTCGGNCGQCGVSGWTPEEREQLREERKAGEMLRAAEERVAFISYVGTNLHASFRNRDTSQASRIWQLIKEMDDAEYEKIVRDLIWCLDHPNNPRNKK